MEIQSWIKDHEFVMGVVVFIIFLVIASNKNNYKRFVTVILDCISAAGNMILNFSESLLGVLSAVEDFFEALTYVLFGNFSPGIRFIMANYIILFASIVSFLTTLWGLEKILDWRLAIVLSFAIQMVLVLMSLYLAQQFFGEPVKRKKIVEYYLKDCYQKCDVPLVPLDEQKDRENSDKKPKSILRKIGFILKKLIFKLSIVPSMIVTIFLVIISSMLTYVYLYDTILDDYVLYKTAYALMEEVEKDTSENIEKLDGYYKNAKIILNGFWEKAKEEDYGGNSLNEFFYYLDGRPLQKVGGDTEEAGEEKRVEEIFQNLEEYIRGMEKEGHAPASNESIVWDQNNVQLTECASKDDIVILARNILDLTLYSSRKLGDIKPSLEQLRRYLVEVEVQPESGKQGVKKIDKKMIQDKVQKIIFKENELYSDVPILKDIDVLVGVNGKQEIQQWKKPIERDYATKYEHYLEMVDTRILVPGRAFDALLNMGNTFLWRMFALSFIADILILISCFVRAKQNAGTSNRLKQNLIHSVFIKSSTQSFGRDDIMNILFILAGVGILIKSSMRADYQIICIIMTVIAWIIGSILKVISLFTGESEKGSGSSEDRGILGEVLTKCGTEILQHIENRVVLKVIYRLRMRENSLEEYQSVDMEILSENARSQEFYISYGCILQGKLEKEIVLLCSEELACPVMDGKLNLAGYIITKECMRLLKKEMFDAAKKNGLDIRMLKEDLRENEEDSWI